MVAVPRTSVRSGVVLKTNLKVALWGVAALLLTGCQLTLSVDVVLDGDASGSLTVAVTSDAELQQLASEAGVDPLGRMVERIQNLDSPWQVAEETSDTGGARTLSLRSEFAGPEEFALRYTEMLEVLQAPEARLLGPLTVSLDEETDLISLSGELPLEVTQVAADDYGVDVADLTSQLDGVVQSTLTVTTPGAVQRSNAAQILVEEETVAEPYPDAPATMSWQARPGSVTQVAATFERGGLDLLRVAIFGGLGLLAVLLILGGVLAQRRRR